MEVVQANISFADDARTMVLHCSLQRAVYACRVYGTCFAYGINYLELTLLVVLLYTLVCEIGYICVLNEIDAIILFGET
jgi:hypothetical protein